MKSESRSFKFVKSASEKFDTRASQSSTSSSEPSEREVLRSKSCILEVPNREGMLTFASSVNDLPRAGSSRAVMGDCAPKRPSRP
jgi:hypothetical protein